MRTDVFNRYEQKFVLDQNTYVEIIKMLSSRMHLDPHNDGNAFYTVSNIYYDTESDDLIKKSLSKPVYKEKLRLRAYGIPTLEDKVFLEIKKKVAGLVNKRRTVMTLSEAYDFLATQQMPEIQPYHNRQVLREIAFFMKQYTLVPSVVIIYERKALFCDDLRITFDTHIRARRTELKLESSDWGKPFLEDGQWLMEVKAEQALPIWFVKILSEHKLYSTGFSKVGKEYLTRNESTFEFETLKGETVTCLNRYLMAPQVVL